MNDQPLQISEWSDSKLKKEMAKGTLLLFGNCSLIFMLIAASLFCFALGESANEKLAFKTLGYYFVIINGLFLLLTYYRNMTKKLWYASIITGIISCISYIGILSFAFFYSLKNVKDKKLILQEFFTKVLNPTFNEKGFASLRIMLGFLALIIIVYAVIFILTIYSRKLDWNRPQFVKECKNRVLLFLQGSDFELVNKYYQARIKNLTCTGVIVVSLMLQGIFLWIESGGWLSFCMLLFVIGLSATIYYYCKTLFYRHKLASPFKISFIVLRTFIKSKKINK